VLAICGGLQMLGEDVDGSAGLGVLPLATSSAPEKQTERVSTRFQVSEGPWSALAGLSVGGYLIRHGRSTPTAPVAAALPDGLGFVDGAVVPSDLPGLGVTPLEQWP
jgi:cobyric acid synthase